MFGMEAVILSLLKAGFVLDTDRLFWMMMVIGKNFLQDLHFQMPIPTASAHTKLSGVSLPVYILKESVKVIGLELYFLFCFVV